jgi:hypothetical protein
MAELPKPKHNWTLLLARWSQKRSHRALAACVCIGFLVALFAASGPTCTVKSPVPLVTMDVEKERPVVSAQKAKEDYTRTPDNAYLTFPEWFIVFSSQEYAGCISENPPSSFPYFSSIGQYWGSYAKVFAINKKQYGFNLGDQVMLVVIGGSYSAEMAAKGLYENTVGRLTEWAGGTDTDEDRFAQAAYTRYVSYIPTYPFYQYSYLKDLKGLWTQTSWWGPHFVRKWERRLVLSAEYATKAAYTSVIEYLTHALYGVEGQDTYAELSGAAPDAALLDPRVHILAQQPDSFQTSLPRYQAFTEVALPLARDGFRFNNIAGNAGTDFITLSVLVGPQFGELPRNVETLFTMDVLTAPGTKRLMLRTPVFALSDTLVFIDSHQGVIEHIFDY